MIKPQGIQFQRVKGYRLQEASMALNGLPAKKVDRTTDFGNPFRIGFEVPDADEAVRMFKVWCPADSPLGVAAYHILRGHNLACSCKIDAPCHRNWLLEIANR